MGCLQAWVARRYLENTMPPSNAVQLYSYHSTPWFAANFFCPFIQAHTAAKAMCAA